MSATTSTDSWGSAELRRLVPAVEVVKRPEPVWSTAARAGVTVDGVPQPVFLEWAPEELERSHGSYGEFWTPVPEPAFSDAWSLLDAGLLGGDREFVDAHLVIGPQHLVGVLRTGTGFIGPDSDDQPVVSDLKRRGRFLSFGRALTDIDEIVILRVRRMMKTTDGEFLVRTNGYRAVLRARLVNRYGGGQERAVAPPCSTSECTWRTLSAAPPAPTRRDGDGRQERAGAPNCIQMVAARILGWRCLHASMVDRPATPTST